MIRHIVKFKLLLIPFIAVLCSCASSIKTFAELRLEKSENNAEVWEIRSISETHVLYENIFNALKKKAAEKSNAEGKNCFVMIDSTSNPYVPTGSTFVIYRSTASLYVSFYEYYDCKNFEKTEWQGRMWYNNEIIRNIKHIEASQAATSFFVGSLAVALFFMPIIIIVSDPPRGW
jgi:hypothetical protein